MTVKGPDHRQEKVKAPYDCQWHIQDDIVADFLSKLVQRVSGRTVGDDLVDDSSDSNVSCSQYDKKELGIG